MNPGKINNFPSVQLLSQFSVPSALFQNSIDVPEYNTVPSVLSLFHELTSFQSSFILQQCAFRSSLRSVKKICVPFLTLFLSSTRSVIFQVPVDVPKPGVPFGQLGGRVRSQDLSLRGKLQGISRTHTQINMKIFLLGC